MIPRHIIEYLRASDAPFRRRAHPRAVTAQELASALHVPGRRVAKSLLVRAGDRKYIAVLPATTMLDEERFARAVRAREVELMKEEELRGSFASCEPGAEPPFGGLYGVPVVVDDSFEAGDQVVFRAGSHEEAIEMCFEDFIRLEHPEVAHIGRRIDALAQLHG
jgi:Ala-tRNA(Pro) deacylase